MTPEQWQQVKAIFHAATELPYEERASFIQQRTNGDVELLQEVKLLLESHAEAEHFIEKPALVSASEILPTRIDHSRAGETIGQYRVVREIGSGGMGVVLLAVRDDDQFEKRVAIKLLRRGMDTEDLLRRFRNERQILASLEHPHIARLIDGGMTEDGLPYFVLEYVEGQPLDKYCEEQRLATSDRLDIFSKVCAAVQYAHQNLIVHRDLKPSNILVTSAGEPKLLDFGIAKLLDPKLNVYTIAPTATMARLMTPDYASPEQIRGRTITTASDVYSLGVVLYRLLTGHAPYHFADSSPQEIERLVCDSEPERPSLAFSRVTELSTQHGLTRITPKSVARAHAEAPEAVRRRLTGDLDNIVLMALRKEPERRYQSVEQFSEDIERHLKGLPVLARPNTWGYRTGKFVRRHKVGVTAAALICITLIGGVVATIWQARTAHQERAKAESISAFLEQMLKYSNPILNSAHKNGRETTVDEVLDEAARRLESGEFDSRPEVKAELERTIAVTYFGQGQYHPAEKHMQEYVSLQRQLYGENHPKMIEASTLWAGILFSKGEIANAEKIYRRVMPQMRNEYQNGNIKIEVMADALNNLAYLRRTQGDSREAELLFRESLELIPRLPERERAAVATTRSTLASTLADQGRFSEALATAREAVEEYRRRGETDSPNYGFSLTVLGGFLTDVGSFSEADTCLHDAEVIFRRLLNPAHLWLGDNLRNQSISLSRQGQYREALNKVTETLKIYKESFGSHYDHYPTALIVNGLVLSRTGMAKEGERILREALKIRTESLPTEHFWVAEAMSALGECLTIQKRYDEAEPFLVASYDSLLKSQGKQNPRTLLAQSRLFELYQQWNRPELAAKYAPAS